METLTITELKTIVPETIADFGISENDTVNNLCIFKATGESVHSFTWNPAIIARYNHSQCASIKGFNDLKSTVAYDRKVTVKTGLKLCISSFDANSSRQNWHI